MEYHQAPAEGAFFMPQNQENDVKGERKMLNSLIDRFQKLLAVKSIVTLALTIVFCVLCMNGMIDADQFMAIFTMVIGFYFGTQAERKSLQTVEGAEANSLLPETQKDNTDWGGDV